MLNRFTFGKYIPNDNILYRLNPMFKILSTLIMIILMLFVDSYYDVIMLSFYLFLVILYSDIDISVYFKCIYGIRFFLIFILVIDIIFFMGIDKIVFDLFKLIFIVIYASILTYTTKMNEIIYGTNLLFKPFSSIININDISMIVMIALRYIPTLVDEFNRMLRAQKMRGLNFDNANFKGKIDIISRMIVPLFSLSLKRAEDMADVMDLRLYNYSKFRSNYMVIKWNVVDSLLLIFNILIVIVVIIY